MEKKKPIHPVHYNIVNTLQVLTEAQTLYLKSPTPGRTNIVPCSGAALILLDFVHMGTYTHSLNEYLCSRPLNFTTVKVGQV